MERRTMMKGLGTMLGLTPTRCRHIEEPATTPTEDYAANIRSIEMTTWNNAATIATLPPRLNRIAAREKSNTYTLELPAETDHHNNHVVIVTPSGTYSDRQ